MDTFRRALILTLLFLAACSSVKKQVKLCEASRSLPSMGTFIQISVLHNCSSSVDGELFASTQRRLDEIEQQFSLYIQDSDLSRWNRGERSFKPGRDFNELFGISRNLKIKTHSYFDIEAMKSQGTPVSFDGIAKGYAVEEVARLIEAVAYYYKINFSGNLKWSLPDGAGAAASSGNTHRPGHIVNPKSGKAVLSAGESLVEGPNAMICDALSTAYFAAPVAERARLVSSFPNYKFSFGD